MPLPPPSWVIPAPGCRPRRRWLVRLALALVVLAMLALGALCVGLLVAQALAQPDLFLTPPP